MNWQARLILGVWHIGDDETKQLLAKIPAGSINQGQNAHLIAAAPDLLAACEAALDWINRYGADGPAAVGGEAEIAEQLRAAITKARGEDV